MEHIYEIKSNTFNVALKGLSKLHNLSGLDMNRCSIHQWIPMKIALCIDKVPEQNRKQNLEWEATSQQTDRQTHPI